MKDGKQKPFHGQLLGASVADLVTMHQCSFFVGLIDKLAGHIILNFTT
jgi:hypothetical protein